MIVIWGLKIKWLDFFPIVELLLCMYAVSFKQDLEKEKKKLLQVYKNLYIYFFLLFLIYEKEQVSAFFFSAFLSYKLLEKKEQISSRLFYFC